MDLFSCTVGGHRAARITGVPYRTLDGWIRTGLLPVTKPASGKGSRRQLSFLDLVRARTVARLRSEDVSLQTIRKAVAMLSDRFGIEDPLTQTGRLLVAGDRIYWAVDDATLLDVLKAQLGARPLILVDLGELVLDLSRKVAEVCAA